MNQFQIIACLTVQLLLVETSLEAKELNQKNPVNTPGKIYWCPQRTEDQQFTASPESGCSPLISDKEATRIRDKAAEGIPRKGPTIQSIQTDASVFIRAYNKFLDCCANDPDSIDEIEELHDRSIEILITIQQTGILNRYGGGDCGTDCRQWTLGEIIRTVAHARDDLRSLKARLQSLNTRLENRGELDYELRGREDQSIEREKEAIAKEFRSKRRSDSARTGMEIEDTSLPYRFGDKLFDVTGRETTLKNNYGPDIGEVVSPTTDQKLDLKYRHGPEVQDTTLPNSFGRSIEKMESPTNTHQDSLRPSTGFELGTTSGPTGSSSTIMRSGPGIGDSSTNRQDFRFKRGSGDTEDPAIRNPYR